MNPGVALLFVASRVAASRRFQREEYGRTRSDWTEQSVMSWYDKHAQRGLEMRADSRRSREGSHQTRLADLGDITEGLGKHQRAWVIVPPTFPIIPARRPRGRADRLRRGRPCRTAWPRLGGEFLSNCPIETLLQLHAGDTGGRRQSLSSEIQCLAARSARSHPASAVSAAALHLAMVSQTCPWSLRLIFQLRDARRRKGVPASFPEGVFIWLCSCLSLECHDLSLRVWTCGCCCG